MDIRRPWDRYIDKELVDSSIRKYKFRSCKDLLRVIRNKQSHYFELSPRL